MRIYLFRHAERENSGAPDPSLSARGQRQAEMLKKLVETSALERPDRLWISPKKRTQQTFAAVASISTEPLIVEDLNERQSHESHSQLSQRVRRVLKDSAQTPGVTYLCSHLDWIEEALIAIPSNEDLQAPQFQHWEPAQHMIFEIQDGIWHLVKFGGIQI